MGTTTKLLLPYPEDTDPADVPADMRELAERLDLVAVPALVSSLPASPADGDECYYLANAAAGVVWHLRYRAAASGTSKWEYLGGPPLAHEIATVEQCFTTTLGDLATVGPTLTAPVAGEYDAIFGCNTYNGTVAAVMQGGLSIGGAAAASDLAISIAAVNDTHHMHRERRITAAAGGVVKLQYSANVGPGFFRWRYLLLRPVRVG